MRLIDADRLLDRCIFYHLPNGDLAVPIIDVQHAPTVEAPDINVGNIGTISRQVAIDMLDEQIELCNASLQKGVPEKDAYAIKVERASLMAYREKLECLPFVQPERKPGRWIWQKRSYTFDGEKREILVKVCSYCEKPPIAGVESPYCPHCGEKKEGEWNDT